MSLIYVAPSGTDTGTGAFESPYKTLQHATSVANDGDRVLVRSGIYTGDWEVSRPGVYVGAYNSEAVHHTGRLWITRDAPRFTLQNVTHNGRNINGLPSPTVNASDAQFLCNDVSNENTCIGYMLGSPFYGRSDRIKIVGGSIHHCGKLPAKNHDHGIYAEACSDIQVDLVQIYGNADRGIQLYWDCQGGSFTRLQIVGNGENVLFSGAGPNDEPGITTPTQCNNNVFDYCHIIDSIIRNNVESYYPSGVHQGTGNVIKRSTIGGGTRGNINHGIDTSTGGFTIDPSCILI